MRINLDTFQWSDVSVIDLTTIDEDLRGFASGFQGGQHGYLVPYSKGFGDYSSKVVRFSLVNFVPEEVEVLDLRKKNDQLMGFTGGFSYATYAVFVPYQNGRSDVNFRSRSQFGTITRVNMNDFTVNGIKTLDVTSVYRKNTPDFPDRDLRGFVSGFCAGSFMFLVPLFNGVWHGKMARIDMRDFDMLADAQEAGQSTDFVTGFKGVQELDLQNFHEGLAGFSGGFIRKRPSPSEDFYDRYRLRFIYASGMNKDQSLLVHVLKSVESDSQGAVMPEGGSQRSGEEESIEEGSLPETSEGKLERDAEVRS